MFRLIRLTSLIKQPQRFFSLSSPQSSSPQSSSSSHPRSQPIKLNRSLLYIPGDNTKKLEKSKTFINKCDCIIYDCEDGVAINRKTIARNKIRELFELNELSISSTTTDLSVRINPINSDEFLQDLYTIFTLPINKRPRTILIPKLETIEQLRLFNQELIKIKQPEPLKMLFYIESGNSLLNLIDLCKKAFELSENDKCFIPIGIIFGSDDFCASIGATRTQNSMEILYARQFIVLIAKSFNIQAIDMVHIDYKDLIGLNEQSIFGAQMGYTGKQIIHPNHIDIVQNAYTPSRERIEWAKNIINAFNESQKLGKGAFTFNNQMIDMPTVKQAENLLKTYENLLK